MTGVEPAYRGLRVRCITVLLHVHSTLYRTRICIRRLGISRPILLDEQGIKYSAWNSNPYLGGRSPLSYPIRRTEHIIQAVARLPGSGSNRHVQQSKCCALPFGDRATDYPGRTRTASDEIQNLAPYQFGDWALCSFRIRYQTCSLVSSYSCRAVHGAMSGYRLSCIRPFYSP